MRRRRAVKRVTPPDPKYGDAMVSKFINVIMVDGKKSIAEKIVYGAFDIASEKLDKKNPLEIFIKAIDNARPLLELKARRVGGATYQVPIEVSKNRGIEITFRWIRDFARSKKGKPMQQRLAEEIISAFKGEGSAIKKRDDTHKMAEANKAFAHFRW